MFGYIFATITFIYLCIKRNSDLSQASKHFSAAGIAEEEITKLRRFLWLYLPAILLSFSAFGIFAGALFVPGIRKGKAMHSTLDASGVDYGVKAGKLANDIAWLGIGGLIYVVAASAFYLTFEVFKRNA